MREQTRTMLLDEAAKGLRRGAEAVKREDWTAAHAQIATALALIVDVHDSDEWLDSVNYAARTGENTWNETRSAEIVGSWS